MQRHRGLDAAHGACGQERTEEGDADRVGGLAHGVQDARRDTGLLARNRREGARHRRNGEPDAGRKKDPSAEDAAVGRCGIERPQQPKAKRREPRDSLSTPAYRRSKQGPSRGAPGAAGRVSGGRAHQPGQPAAISVLQ